MDGSNKLSSRDFLLARALADAKKWCVGASATVGARPSDQYWVALFRRLQSEPITEKEAHLFLTTFQLTNRVIWDKANVAAQMCALREQEPFEPVESIQRLAHVLRGCNARGTRQTSAASKLAMFAKPSAEVFIWDALASRSARMRDSCRDAVDGTTPKRRASMSIYTTADGEHDYAAFHAACARALHDEQRRPDFVEAAAMFAEYLAHTDGPMADRMLVPRSFVERRLLDKLMFWEGWGQKYGDMRPF